MRTQEPGLFKNNADNDKKLWLIDHFQPSKKKTYLHTPPDYYIGMNLGSNFLNSNEHIYSTDLNGAVAAIGLMQASDQKHLIKINHLQSDINNENYKLEGHTGFICALGFSKDAKRLVSCSADETIRLWDLDKKTCIARLDGTKFPMPSDEVKSRDPHCIVRIICIDENTFHIELLDRSVKALYFVTEKEIQSKIPVQKVETECKKQCIAM